MAVLTTQQSWRSSSRCVSDSRVWAHILNSTQALEHGDAVCLFPEGMSRYHPTIAPLKTGGQSPIWLSPHAWSANGNVVARLVSDVLSRNRHNANFEVSVLTCSITYM